MASVILLIDERPELPEGVAKTLRSEGYVLVHTTDPEEAIRLVEEREPALVMMELQFSSCDGPDLMAGIRAPERGDVPVLIVTRAPRHSPLHGEAIAQGAVDFLTKPVLDSELLGTIHEVAPPPPKAEPKRARRRPAQPDPSGSLSSESLPEVLAGLHRLGASGVLIAVRDKVQVGIQMRNGTVIALDSNRRRSARADIHDLSETDVAAAISRRAETELFEAFGWTEGTHRFVDKKRLKSDSVLGITRDIGSLLLTGIIEASPPERARDWLRKRTARYACAAADAGEGLEDVDLTPPQEQALAELAGDGTLEELLEAQLFEEKLLYGLCVAGRIELHTEPLLTLTLEHISRNEALDAEPDETPMPDDASHRDEDEDGQRLPKAEVDPRPATAREEPEPAAEAVDPSSADRALEAERWFRKGKGLLGAKKYDEAGEAFGMATHLDPDEGDYLSHLGYALYLTKPNDDVVQREAMEHIAKGIKQSPNSDLSYVYLGRILHKKGETETARKVLGRALQINPDCHAANQTLRLLEMRDQKGKGLLSRLWKR